MKTLSFRLLLLSAFAVSACTAPITDPRGPDYSSTAAEESSASSIPTPPSLQDVGIRYHNAKAGYSLLIPKAVDIYNIACDASGNRPEDGEIIVESLPIVALDDGTQTYVTYGYEYGERCTKKIHDVAWMKRYFAYGSGNVSWVLKSADIADDAALDAFVRERYGNGCMPEKKPTEQEGTFDIIAKGKANACASDRSVMKYAPALRRMVYWNLDDNFSTFGSDLHGSYFDREMIDSFRFE